MTETTQTSSQTGYLVGQLLVAMPQMTDPRFHESVILLCSHDENGAMGVVVNKVIDSLSFSDLLKQLNIALPSESNAPKIHYGGPVEIGRGFVLHSADYTSPTSKSVTKAISLSATTTIIEDCIQGQGPKQILIALGYAGWSAGQLESEIMKNGWLTVEADPSLIFSEDALSIWRRTLEKIGVTPENLSTFSGHA
jgi:putative transcriptional regulator